MEGGSSALQGFIAQPAEPREAIAAGEGAANPPTFSEPAVEDPLRNQRVVCAGAPP